MKKFITLLFSLGIFTVSFAQSNHHGNWNDRDDQYTDESDRAYNDHDRAYNNNRNFSYENQYAIEVQKINQDYNYQVMSIENNPYMRNHQKRAALRNAERERDWRIQHIKGKYNRMNSNWERR